MLNKRRLTMYAAALVAVPLAALPGGSIILAIVGIGFLIFIHEWGHFYACKLTGTRTETFSIGFGPRLFGWEKDRDGNRRFTTGARQLDPIDHAMDFRIALIPLGGYVKMAGELPGEATTGAPDEFPQKSAAARAFIISAGVIMNFFTAILFYAIAYGAGKPYEPATVGRTIAGGPAHRAGLRAGDLMLELDGIRIDDRIDLLTEAALMPRDEDIDLVFERDGKRMGPVKLRGRFDEEVGRMQIGITMPGIGLELGEGDDKLTIGPRTPATVQGLRVVGGEQAHRRIDSLIGTGHRSIEVSVEGKSLTLKPKPLEKPPETLPVKIGLTNYEVVTVRGVMGPAGKVLEVGDELLSVVPATGDPIRITNKLSLTRATVGGVSLKELVVTRGGERKVLPVALPDAQHIVDFFMDVDLKFDGKGTRVSVFGPEHSSYFIDGTVYTSPSAPARDAGLKTGQRVLRVGERDVASYNDILTALKGLEAGKPVDFWVEADGGKNKISITPVALEVLGVFPQTAVRNTSAHATEGLVSALGIGASRTMREVKNVFRTIGALFAGRLSFQKNIAGPITLVRASKNMAEDSFLRLIWFLAYVSVMLAVLNILPIPVLDGGHLMFILIEKVKGSPLSDTAMMRFQQVGLLMLLALMFFAFKNDIMRL